jgi:transcription-repair coupling factor (superfamily II helicase)
LGLIVFDEEQKFGVEDKEKLKNKYPNIDVLTLSATPIPRTLNMSLSGIRDISIISTPPSERLPIQTYVMEYSESLVKDAIMRELNRDGQVFILFNSVEKIYTFAEQIRRLVPTSSILVAHGQMNSKALEQVIYDFYHRKGDILICTTIIENGIDIENANTLIVCDSDKLGLSQLYQIRGRVGRGSRLAYAYFTYDGRKILTEEAYKRLDAMSEFCEFGSGFKLAMRDLEIRGGGNILGVEQSGHMQKIGYDMYLKMLSDAVKEIKGENVEEQRDVLVKVAIDAYVPETYISLSEDRMVAYKRISSLDLIESAEKLKVELVQTYGKIPEVTLSLISVALVRHLAGKMGAIEVHSFGNEVDIIFEKPEDITSNHLIAEAIYKFRMNCSIDLISRPMIKFSKEPVCRDNFEICKKFLLVYDKLLQENLAK